MTDAQEPLVQAIHRLWFGTLDQAGHAPEANVKQWFGKSSDFDSKIRKHYLEYVDPAFMGAFDRWIVDDEGLVALIVLLDQFTRNMFRDTPRAFAYDKKALATSVTAIQSSRFLQLPAVHAYFVLMPTMHCEDLGIQDLGVKSFKELLERVAPSHQELIGNALRYAEAHRSIIARFGRFPHRNAILGRHSTAEETAFLKEPGSSF